MYRHGYDIIKNRKPVVMVAGMVLLLILSSCTVRKLISNELELPVAKQLNPSRATIHTAASCHLNDPRGRYNISVKGDVDTSLLSSVKSKVEFFSFVFNSGLSQFYSSQGWPLSVKIPAYILFKKMKYWIYALIPFCS